MKKGQSWSMDLVIAVVVFGFMAVIFYSLVIIQDQPSVEELEDSAERINAKLEQGLSRCGSIIEGQVIDQAQLQCLFGYSYEELKQELNIEGEFCIYLESTEGGLYIVHNGTAGNKTAFGNPALVISGTPCGQVIAATSGGIKSTDATQGETRCITPENLQPSSTISREAVVLSWNPVEGAQSYMVRLYNTTPSTTTFYNTYRMSSCYPAYRCYTVPTTSISNVPTELGVSYSFTVEPVFSPARPSCSTEQRFSIAKLNTAPSTTTR